MGAVTRPLATLATGTAAVAAAGFSWGVHEARSRFTLRRHEMAIPALGSPLRILHLSDLHLLPADRNRVRFIRSLVEHSPDLVVLTGDTMASPAGLATVAEALDELLGVPGVFVFGSNDYHAPRFRMPLAYLLAPSSRRGPALERLPAGELANLFEERGWLNLNNRRGRLTVRGVELTFVGVDDPHIGFDRFPADDGVTGDLHVGVAHAPYTRILDEFLLDGCHLGFFGHTHGGQVCVPGYGPLVTNCDLPRWRGSGLQGWPGLRPDGEAIEPRRLLAPIPEELHFPTGAPSMWVNISAGLGQSPFAPFRFACPPEASLLRLSPSQTGGRFPRSTAVPLC